MSQMDTGPAHADNPARPAVAPDLLAASAAAFGTDEGAALPGTMRAYAENKGWLQGHNPLEAALKSYRELEKKLGGSVPLPEDGDDEGIRKLFGRLGMPETADGYALPLPEDHDPDLAASVREIFHGANLTKAQAAAVYEGYMALAAPLLEARERERETGAASAAAAAKELGEAGMTGARAAFARFVGTDAALAEKLEKTLGDGEMIRFFHRLARATGEDGGGHLGIGSAREAAGPQESFRAIIDKAFKHTRHYP